MFQPDTLQKHEATWFLDQDGWNKPFSGTLFPLEKLVAGITELYSATQGLLHSFFKFYFSNTSFSYIKTIFVNKSTRFPIFQMMHNWSHLWNHTIESSAQVPWSAFIVNLSFFSESSPLTQSYHCFTSGVNTASSWWRDSVADIWALESTYTCERSLYRAQEKW